MQQELQQSLEKLNTAQVQQQIENAMKSIDVQKIQAKVQAELGQVNIEKMQQDLAKMQVELKNNLDNDEMRLAIKKSLEASQKAMAELKSVNMEKIQQELELAKAELKQQQGTMKQDMEKARQEINRVMQKDFKKEFENALREMDRASAELKNYQDMLAAMDKDGLLNMQGSYTVEYNQGKLIINGTPQPEHIVNKYKHYFKKEKVTLRRGKDDGERSIDF